MPPAKESLPERLSRLIREDGVTPTAISFAALIRCSSPTPLIHGVLRPSICLVIQGGKRRTMGKQTVDYGAGHYVVASIDMPSSCGIAVASRAKPYLGIAIDLNPDEIAVMAVETGRTASPSDGAVPGAYLGKTSAELAEAVTRLLGLLDQPRDIPFLANAIRHEILYRLLTSPGGPAIYRNLLPDPHGRGVSKALHWIKNNFAAPMTIEDLAKEAAMSVSALHHKFKGITTLSPLQYQKRLRLTEARRLLLTGTVDAATAGFRVGYESPSQFSREYHRLFGAPPLKDVGGSRETLLREFGQE